MVFTVRVKDKIATATNMLRLRNWITTRLYLIVFEHCDTSQLLIDCYQVDYKSQNTSSKNIQKPWTIQRIIQMLIHILDKRCSTFSGLEILFRHSCHLLNIKCVSKLYLRKWGSSERPSLKIWNKMTWGVCSIF
jgi:hypothetical protein